MTPVARADPLLPATAATAARNLIQLRAECGVAMAWSFMRYLSPTQTTAAMTIARELHEIVAKAEG